LTEKPSFGNTFCPDFGVNCPNEYTEPGPKCNSCYIEKHGSKINVITRDAKTGEEKKKPNMVEKALETLANYHFKTPEDVEMLYVFRNGEYIQGETFVKSRMESIFGDKTNTGTCGEVINHLKRRSYVPREDFNINKGVLPVENGLLDLETGVLSEFTPDLIFTFKIKAKYDPDKRSEKWLKFIEEVMPNEEDRLALQEYAGYTLYAKMPYHKIAFLVGEGRNGKGVFVRTVQGILGVDNVSNIRIDYLGGGHRFAATNLYGKLMNVSSEPSTRWPLQTELLKQLTGEDWLDGEVKGKQNPIRFQPFAKHFVLANKLPKVNDTSIGWWDRVLLIEFTQTFTDEKGNRIADLEDTWLVDADDRSGILNWLIEGWVRLQSTGKFTQSKTQRESMIRFKRASDPIAAFLVEACEYDPSYYEQRMALYVAYKDYASSLNALTEGNRTFFDRVRNWPGVRDGDKKFSNKSQRVFYGLRLRSDDETDAPDAPDALPTSPHKNQLQIGEWKKGVEIHVLSASSASPPETQPKHTCERCGAPGSIRYKSKWLCQSCGKKEIEEDQILG